MTSAPTKRLRARWLRARLPAQTIRLRLTLVYGSLSLLFGAGLLGLTYVLVRRQYTSGFFITSGQVGGGAFAVTQTSVGASAPSKAMLAGAPSPASVVAAAHAQSSAALHQLLVSSGIAFAAMAVLSLWLGWVIAGRALGPLRTITNAAREISASSLHRRLALAGPDDELKQLGTTFDGLLERLEASFAAQRQFVANASHELRTPLTLQRTLLEVALADPNATTESMRQTCAKVLAAGEHQERLIETLLTLSRSQRGLDRHEPVDLAAIAEATAAAVDHDGLAVDLALAPARTAGDPRLVERLVANLVSNAVRYNVPRGSVRLDTLTRGDRAVLTVANTGPLVPSTELARIFRPFERLDGDRAAGGDGLGLGLSIVEAIADAHDAGVTARARPEGGLEIEVAFPAGAVAVG